MKELIKPIAEFAIRLFGKSPKFFQGIQWIIFLITAALGVLTAAQANGLFAAPEWVQQYLGGDSILMGILAYILAKLPVENTAVKENMVQNFLGK